MLEILQLSSWLFWKKWTVTWSLKQVDLLYAELKPASSSLWSKFMCCLVLITHLAHVMNPLCCQSSPETTETTVSNYSWMSKQNSLVKLLCVVNSTDKCAHCVPALIELMCCWDKFMVLFALYSVSLTRLNLNECWMIVTKRKLLSRRHTDVGHTPSVYCCKMFIKSMSGWQFLLLYPSFLYNDNQLVLAQTGPSPRWLLICFLLCDFSVDCVWWYKCKAQWMNALDCVALIKH